MIDEEREIDESHLRISQAFPEVQVWTHTCLLPNIYLFILFYNIISSMIRYSTLIFVSIGNIVSHLFIGKSIFIYPQSLIVLLW